MFGFDEDDQDRIMMLLLLALFNFCFHVFHYSSIVTDGALLKCIII